MEMTRTNTQREKKTWMKGRSIETRKTKQKNEMKEGNDGVGKERGLMYDVTGLPCKNLHFAISVSKVWRVDCIVLY